MYFSDLGFISLLLAAGFAVLAIALSIAGALRKHTALVASAKRSVLAVTCFLLLASASLIISFLTHDFGVSYVAQHSSLSMPWYFTASAFYGGQEGSLLYWALMLSVFSAIFIFTSKRAPTALVPYVMATLMAIEIFFLLMLVSVSNPFARLPVPLANGVGLNPLLMDPGMLVHPPMLLMGYMSFSVPFAFAVAAMITGQLGSEWLRAIRRWMLAAWAIQTTGLLLGAWWAYHVLGWGGYWGWDPVENAALLPWLTATAFLHSTMVQERRGMLKVWNLALVALSFTLSIFGTFEVRSGIISSVHSFAYSAIGGYFLAFLALIIVFSTALFIFRLPRLRPEQEFDSAISREGSFLLNNFLLLGVTFATLWGTLFPLISQAFTHQTLTVGPPFYEQVNGPILLILILAMGVGPLLAWRRTSIRALWRNLGWPALAAAVCAAVLPLFGVRDVWANVAFAVCAFTAGAILYEVWRGVRVRHKHGEAYPIALFMLINRYRQRYGGYIVHLGFVLLAVGVIGSNFFQSQKDADLKPGQSISVSGYQPVYLGNIDEKYPDVETITAQLQVWHDGQLQQYIYPARQFYPNFDNQPASQISITTHDLTDLYVFLANWDGLSQATIRVFVNPLVTFVWLGGVFMLFGGIICWWPERKKRHVKQFVKDVSVEDQVVGTRATARVPSQPDPTPAPTMTRSVVSKIRNHSRGEGGVDEGRGPLRSPSYPFLRHSRGDRLSADSSGTKEATP
ncbi:MAG TPA: heme lyase CcmF/NrfE family subunit [Ktedonobacteraceae bacterium]|nr:heme lyase CcmF/NrfE family subunit [Ktedonobacteraceae bacterium]